MAKLRMKKIELIAMLSDSKKIIELLQRRGVVELYRNDSDELTDTNVTAVVGEFEKFRNTAVQALEIIDNHAPEKIALTSMLEGRKEVDKDILGQTALKLEKTMNSANEIIRCQRTITESDAAIAQLNVKIDLTKQWSALDVPMNFKGTSTTSAFIGSVPFNAEETPLDDDLPKECYAEVVSINKEQSNLFVLCSKNAAEDTENALRKLGFIPVSEPARKTADEMIDEYVQERSKLEAQSEDAAEKIVQLAENRSQLHETIDYLQMRKDKYSALSSLGFTGSTFVLNGYIPEKYCEALEKEITKKYTASITFSEPAEDDDVPVLLENSNFSAPLESITKMYDMPSKKDIDPTSVMSFFYYLFFGMMLSDAGYGLVMVIGTIFALKKFNLESSMKKTLVMFRNCGISTLIWGALFGSWFGDLIQVIGREYFGKEIGSVALWFEPIDDPIKLLLFSFGLGIIHLFFGVGVSFKMAWDDGRKLDAFLDTIPVYLTVLGAAAFGAGIFVDVPEILTSVGKYFLLIGAILLVLTQGRSSKSIFGKFFGGLYALYNTATGYLSDILSYSRLLALGLATGSIAGVINLIGTMPQNMVIKTVLFIVVFIIGHTANLAINLLGAYVHTDRLQFVELFSKFYSGGGREFEPLTANTQYIKFKEEKDYE